MPIVHPTQPSVCPPCSPGKEQWSSATGHSPHPGPPNASLWSHLLDDPSPASPTKPSISASPSLKAILFQHLNTPRLLPDRQTCVLDPLCRWLLAYPIFAQSLALRYHTSHSRSRRLVCDNTPLTGVCKVLSSGPGARWRRLTMAAVTIPHAAPAGCHRALARPASHSQNGLSSGLPHLCPPWL